MDVNTHPDGGFFLSQTSDILKCVAKHGLSDAKPIATPGVPISDLSTILRKKLENKIFIIVQGGQIHGNTIGVAAILQQTLILM